MDLIGHAKISIDRFIEETNRAKSSMEVSELFGKALKNFGYDRFCYSLITAHPSVGLEEQAMALPRIIRTIGWHIIGPIVTRKRTRFPVMA